MATATTDPITANSRESVGGRVMARRRAVIMAEPSHKDFKGILLTRRKIASVARQAIKQDTYKPTALNLKKYKEARTAGVRAMTTAYMILGTESLSSKWGDDRTIKAVFDIRNSFSVSGS
jgi:hypothetical protein